MKNRLLTLATFGIAVLTVTQGCANSSRIHRRNQADIDQSYALFHQRNGAAPTGSDSSLRHHVKSDFLHAIETNSLNYVEAIEQVRLWFAPCATWKSSPVPGDINTTGDDYGPVLTSDSTMYFTRSRHASTLCATSDVFAAYLRGTNWTSSNVGRPINDCHESSALSYNSRDSSLLLYGQYYLANSKILERRTLSPSYPSDAAQASTIAYIFDPVTDYQPFDSPPVLTPMIQDHTSTAHSRYSADTWASSIIDNQGDVYIAKLNADRVIESPQRMNWPISGGDFDADAVVTPDGSAIFFVSDRPNVMYDYEGKPPLRDRSRLHYWGNTNIYVNPLTDNSEGLHYILGSGVNTPFAERTPSFSSSGDTMYFSSNGLPGYGGMDVYYSVRLRKDSWLEWSIPRNMGRGINTVEDEAWFSESPAGVTFFTRRVNGKLDIYQAVRVPIIRFLRIQPECDVRENITINSVRYDGTINIEEFDASTLDPSKVLVIDTTQTEVHEFIIATNSFEPQRQYQRCDALSDTLDLTYSDITIYPCNAPSVTSTTNAERTEWTFSNHETPASVLNALSKIASYISEMYDQQLSIEITSVPGHDSSLFTAFERSLSRGDRTISRSFVKGNRSTVKISKVR